MEKLTIDFIKKNGFKSLGITNSEEHNFFYERYTHPLSGIIIFFNYFDDGKITYEVILGDYDLHNVGEQELLTLLRVSSKIKKIEEYLNNN